MDQGNFAFSGIRNSTDFLSYEMDQDWRAGVPKLSANVKTPLAYLASLSNRQPATAPLYEWFSERDWMGAVTITGLYTDVVLGTAYNPSSGTTAVGTVLYIKMAEDAAKRFESGHRVRMTDAAGRSDIQADVLAVTLGGASSFVTVRLIQAQTFVSGAVDLSDATLMVDLGMAAPEYSTWGDPKAYDPEHYTNYTQIFSKTIGVTGTQLATSTYRIGDPLVRAKASAALDMNRDIERAFIFGRPSSGIGSNGMPRRTTAGLTYWIATEAAGNVDDFRTTTLSSIASAAAWATNGMKWLNAKLSTVFTWGSDTRLGLVGNGTLAAIDVIVKNESTYNIYHNESAYGINISILETPYGTLALHKHQLFTTLPADNSRMLIVDPANLGIKDLRPFQYKEDLTKELGSAVSVDGIKEGYLAECGTLIDHPLTMMDLKGFGYVHDTD